MNSFSTVFGLFALKSYSMKNIFLYILAIVCLLSSCKGSDPVPPYVYEANPHYSFGYAEFFGAYYAAYGNKNNVISLSLFSDSLSINNLGNLVGFGQYLFLEDVFVDTTDTILPQTTYTIDDSGLPNTVAPGKNDTIDDQIYTLGATISYYEQNAAKSTVKRITSGTFTLSKVGSNYNIVCNFKTADKKDLKGSFSARLPYFDESLTNPGLAPRKRLIYLPR